jgi:translation elongation factor EF-4
MRLSRQLIGQVYAGVFPIDGGEFPKLEEAIERVRIMEVKLCMKADEQ